ncbi:MAG: 16S rRNA (adenine(1518)-N(6)/adenine(1519)-N(6))-dimethyltransferase RsmA [Acidimicrobiales bacterium]
MALTRTKINELLERHGLTPSRALGQNFLADGAMIDKIVRLAGVGPGDLVVEIGPGLGSLTLGLCRAGAEVVAIEIDRYLIPALQEVVGRFEATGHQPVAADRSGSVKLINADVRQVDWDQLLDGRSAKVVANLPYNIATPLILDLLVAEPRLTTWLVMVQREAGERLVAGPGSKTYGIPSVLLSYWAEARIVGSVRPELFLPRPKVESVLVRIERSPRPRVDADFDRLAQLVRTSFGQRRKMLRRSLAPSVTIAQLEAAAIEPTARPEELAIEDWARLANVAP